MKFLEKFPWLAKMDKQKWVVILLVGILLLVIALPTEKKSPSLSPELPVEQEEESDYETQLERRLVELLEQMEGVGNVDVMITLEEAKEDGFYQNADKLPEVRGVLVVAEGASDSVTRVKIYEAVQALFSIDAHKISIVEMGAQEAK